MEKITPTVDSKLRHIVKVPQCIYDVSGITINGKRIKSLVFSTDVAVISNCNADAVIAVYPFTPTMQITNAIIEVAQKPVFAGVGGGTTSGPRVNKIALDAELHGATAVVLNAPTKTKFVQELSQIIDIPIVLTVVSTDEPLNRDGDGNELLLSDILGTDPDVTSRQIEDEVDKKLLKASIAKLSNREKNIMELRFGFMGGNEKTQKEVADMLGISQSYISRLEKKIIGKMKQGRQ